MYFLHSVLQVYTTIISFDSIIAVNVYTENLPPLTVDIAVWGTADSKGSYPEPHKALPGYHYDVQ